MNLLIPIAILIIVCFATQTRQKETFVSESFRYRPTTMFELSKVPEIFTGRNIELNGIYTIGPDGDYFNNTVPIRHNKNVIIVNKPEINLKTKEIYVAKVSGRFYRTHFDVDKVIFCKKLDFKPDKDFSLYQI